MKIMRLFLKFLSCLLSAHFSLPLVSCLLHSAAIPPQIQDLKKHTEKLLPHFAGSRMQDAHEFMGMFIDTLKDNVAELYRQMGSSPDRLKVQCTPELYNTWTPERVHA